MKLAYFLLWLADGGLVAVEAYVGRKFLKLCELKPEAEAQELWDLLVRQERARPAIANLFPPYLPSSSNATPRTNCTGTPAVLLS